MPHTSPASPVPLIVGPDLSCKEAQRLLLLLLGVDAGTPLLTHHARTSAV